MNARFDEVVWAGVERRLAEVERLIPAAPPWRREADLVAGGVVRAGTAFGRPDTRQSARRRRLVLALTVVGALLALAAAVLLVGAPKDQVDRRDEPFGPFGIYRSSDSGGSAVALPDGRVLIASGSWANMGQAVTSGTQIWDPTDGLIAAGAPAIGRVASAATLLLDGRVLVTGGFGGPFAYSSSAVAVADLWDPDSGTFSATGSMSVPRVGHTATLLKDGRVLVIGGTGRAGFLTSAEIWDAGTSGFQAAGDLSGREGSHTATLLPSGDVLVLGRGPGEVWLSATQEFTPAPGLSVAGDFATATTLLDGRILVIRGQPDRPLAPPAASIVHDALTSIPAGSLLQPRTRYAATLLLDGRVLITGGVGFEGGPPLTSVEVFDPASGSSVALPPLAQPVADHMALLLPDGRILIVFDVNGADAQAEPFTYGPAALSASQ